MELQAQGAHNINLVSATPYTRQVIEALEQVKEKLPIPVVWNSSGYECTETLELLKGYVDIYLPDLKYFDASRSKRYSNAADYFAVASRAISVMFEPVSYTHLDVYKRQKNNSASLSYWMGLPFWNRGFCTEAAQAMIDFGFEQMGFHRIWAKHWAINTASGRIMEKCGMRKEGVMIEAEFRDGEFRDMVYYAILRREWEEKKA